MTIEEAFGAVVRDLRRSRGKRWRHISELTGLSHNTIWEIEVGKVSIKLINIYKLAKALDLEADELVKLASIRYREARY